MKLGVFNALSRWIDNTKNDLSFNKRVGAYIIDWILGGIFSGLPAILCYGFLTKRSDMFSNLYVFPSLGYKVYWSFLAGILCVMFALFYYVYVPLKIYPGQTLGKKWMKIKIVKKDGTDAGLKELLLCYGLGMFLLESGSVVVCQYIRQMITLAFSFYVDYIWQWIGTILIILSVMLAAGTNSHRALHDYFGNTKVISV